MSKLIMKINAISYEIELYNNPSAKTLLNQMPNTLKMSRWGDEYYGGLSKQIPVNTKLQSYFKEGEVALWPDGNAFCIFFGPTPASIDDRPKMASPGVPLGMIVSDDLDALKAMGGQIQVELFAAN